MPTIMTIGNVKIRIFADDHNPPHFHIVTPDYKIAVRIDNFEVLAGRMDQSSFEKAMRWATKNKGVLINEWNSLNTR